MNPDPLPCADISEDAYADELNLLNPIHDSTAIEVHGIVERTAFEATIIARITAFHPPTWETPR